MSHTLASSSPVKPQDLGPKDTQVSALYITHSYWGQSLHSQRVLLEVTFVDAHLISEYELLSSEVCPDLLSPLLPPLLIPLACGCEKNLPTEFYPRECHMECSLRDMYVVRDCECEGLLCLVEVGIGPTR